METSCPTSWYVLGVGVSVVLENAVLIWLMFAVWPRLWNVEKSLRRQLWGEGQAKPTVAAGTIVVPTDREVAAREAQLRADSARRAQVVRTAGPPRSPSRSRLG